MSWRYPIRGAVAVCLLLALGSKTSLAATIPVAAGGDLQAAINAAQPGDIIALAAGATFTGSFVLPNKGSSTQPIVIRSAASDSSLPPAGLRITPASASLLPKIRSSGTLPALRTATAAHHWTLMFLEFQANYRGFGEIIALGAGDSTQTSIPQVPHHFVLDRIYVHGDPVMGQKRCVSLNSSDTTVINSYISNCKGIGQDTQAIGGWNGPGNYLIENNYLEGAGENVLFGGADPTIPNLVTSNIIVRGNYVTKPLAWLNPIAPTPQGVSASAVVGGGSLSKGTYHYKVIARVLSYQGVLATSAPSAEVSATLATTGGVAISWTAVPGANSYLVYGRAANAENRYWTTTGSSFRDTGAAGTSGTPGSSTKWVVKNAFELKNAQDVLVEGNVFENVWVGGQSGYAIVLTPRNQDGTAPWAVVQRVTFRANIIRHAAGGVNILGRDDIAPSQLANHLTFSHNVMDDLTAAAWGTLSRPFQIGDGPDSVTVDHTTIMTTQSSIVSFYGGTTTSPIPVPHFVYTNNMSLHNTYGIMGTGSPPGLPTLQMYAPDSNVSANVLAGGSASKYPTGNYFPSPATWQAGFVNYSGGDYHLISTSPYKSAGTDGTDLGANIDLVKAKTAVALTGDNRSTSGGTPSSVTTITNLIANSPYPLTAGSPVTWTATATNTLGAVEYRFYLYKKTAWVLVQDYSASNKYSWTPQIADVGTPYSVQVWARAVGSTASYEAWRSTSSFDVVLPPLAVTANVDFPTPPGNQVTFTAHLATPPKVPVEYKFQVVNLATNITGVLRDYSPSNQAQWVPFMTGSFMVQCLERQVGSSAAYDLLANTAPLDVFGTPLKITSLSTPTSFPAPTGTPITWTARVQGGLSGPIQYEFHLYSTKKGWRIAQPYGPTETFTWTPTWDDEDDFVLQVWVRNNGSMASYDAYLATNLFHIQRANLQLTTPTLFPVAIGTPVTWTADVPDPSVSMEYKFWLYTAATSQWTVERDYSTQKSINWTPLVLGSYAHQVWARQVGSTSSYDMYRSTGNLDVTSAPAQVVSLIANVPLPAVAGTSITWTAGAIAGTAPLEYQFWRLDKSTWKMVRDYSTDNTYLWITTATDIGSHSIQARVRSIGSAAAYESQMTTGTFTIQ